MITPADSHVWFCCCGKGKARGGGRRGREESRRYGLLEVWRWLFLNTGRYFMWHTFRLVLKLEIVVLPPIPSALALFLRASLLEEMCIALCRVCKLQTSYVVIRVKRVELDITVVLISTAKRCVKIKTAKKRRCKISSNKRWFDKQCRYKRHELRKLSNRYNTIQYNILYLTKVT